MPPPKFKIVGADIGRTQDYSALLVMGVGPERTEDGYILTCGYYKRFQAGVDQTATRIFEVWSGRAIRAKAPVLVDSRSLGAGVCDILARAPRIPLHEISSTNGDRITSYERDDAPWVTHWNTPKKVLVSSAVRAWEQNRLVFLPGSETEQLEKELAAFTPQQSTRTGHVSYEGRGEHDDLVYSLLMACWGSEALAPYYIEDAT